MISPLRHGPPPQRGIVLVAAMLLLVVITILGVAMLRTYDLQARIGGNTREKERALHAAMASQSYAENYLIANNGANAVAPQDCSGQSVASMSINMVCSNLIQTDVATVPWPNYFVYTPPSWPTAGGLGGTYVQPPQLYISFLGASGGAGTPYNAVTGENSSVFQVDAAGWAGNAQTVAVVESTYRVATFQTTEQVSGSQVTKNINLGGP